MDATTVASSSMDAAYYIPSLEGLDRALGKRLSSRRASDLLLIRDATTLAVIVISEIGDKTFLLAALLAMRHPRHIVFIGAFGALLVMSILSAMLGHVLPALIPKRWTTLSAAALFLVFGFRMAKEGWDMEGGTGKVEEELKEVEEELREKKDVGDLESLETGGGGSRLLTKPTSNGNSSVLPPSRSDEHSWLMGLRNLVGLLVSPILVQAFVMTFLAEWGDRSQISTIALAAAHNVYLVTFGTVLGHSICTFVAVMGGKWLATKISVKHVTLGGAALFLIFGVVYTYEVLTWDEAAEAVERVREAVGAAAVMG